ncbi:response regulator transcription factor [Congregibacter sp.]|uniref:response regulator transcription factor n=1 Tax=Congregibacter sp. TaxID=2744308 RepID=UPI003F6CF12C
MTTHLDPKLAALSNLVARCLPALRGDDFAVELIAGLRALVPIDDATVLYYAGGDLPSLVYRETPQARASDTMERFLAGAFLLDPFYKAATEQQRFGVFLLKELAPASFQDSEYYHSWYRNCGFTDECGYLIEVGKDAFVNVALGRVEQQRFSQAQLRTLRSLQPAIEELCRQHWASESGSGEGIRKHLHLALDDFGSSLLTDRETQVINLVLHGHSTKSVATRLGISVETVKLHRKHAYAKLEVSSQAELFYLFLDSLMSNKDYRGGDTLVSYLAKPQQTGSLSS